MISTSFVLYVFGDTYEQIIEKVKVSISEFFDIPIEDVERKLNIDIEINSDYFDSSSEFSNNEEYVAKVTAKVRNV